MGLKCSTGVRQGIVQIWLSALTERLVGKASANSNINLHMFKAWFMQIHFD